MTDPQALGNWVTMYYGEGQRHRGRFLFLPREGDHVNVMDPEGYRFVLRVEGVWFDEDGNGSGEMVAGLKCSRTND
ncbi:hypothetical protein ACMGDM_11320 [Sphingomonas sp. DT-51]|uniref:hypothetical protein n=1 Tax=Sphingomonas sp. DT-51 TaxID=3396165 RepID=UPI003F1B20FC